MPKRNESIHPHKNLLTVALFIIARNWKPHTDEWIITIIQQ